MRKNECYRMVRFPDGFRKYPAGRSDFDGAIEVDLGRWQTEDGDQKFHLRINVAKLPRLIRAIKKARYESKVLYRCLEVFRVAERHTR